LTHKLKTFKMKKILLMLSSIAFLISCQKEVSEPSIIAKKEVKVDNPANPFDYVGIEHNRQLDKFIKDVLYAPQPSYLRTDENDHLQIVFDYFNCDIDQREFQGIYWDKYNLGPEDIDANLSALFAEHPLIIENYDILKNISGDETLDLGEKLESIIELETQVLASDYPEFDKEIILQASAIGRWSLYYWAPKSLGGLGHFDDLIASRPNPEPAQGKPVDWWAVGRSDIWGAASAGFSTANPFVALGWGVVGSALSAADSYWS
jgi:hypothetical protein